MNIFTSVPRLLVDYVIFEGKESENGSVYGVTIAEAPFVDGEPAE